MACMPSACSAVLDASEKQCEVDADCAARGFVEDTCIDNVCVEGKWACLGNVRKVEETPGATHLWRGRFVEMLRTPDSGQFSYFTAHPGITRGGHYHHSKTEKFLVVQGTARFGFRHILKVSAQKLKKCRRSRIFGDAHFCKTAN